MMAEEKRGFHLDRVDNVELLCMLNLFLQRIARCCSLHAQQELI